MGHYDLLGLLHRFYSAPLSHPGLVFNQPFFDPAHPSSWLAGIDSVMGRYDLLRLLGSILLPPHTRSCQSQPCCLAFTPRPAGGGSLLGRVGALKTIWVFFSGIGGGKLMVRGGG